MFTSGKKNDVRVRAISCLAHPYSLAAFGVLILNDHILRIYWPSWWTGKLGDFAWLFFFPFFLMVLLSWIIPNRIDNKDRVTAGIAFGLTGGIFSLAKTWEPLHDLVVRLCAYIFGWQVNWQLDPTDLMALFSLVGAAWLWHHTAQWKVKAYQPAWILLPLAAILTIANSVGPSYGIFCLEEKDDNVYAISSFGTYTSNNGGLSWEEAGEQWIPCLSHFYDQAVTSTTSLSEAIEFSDPTRPEVIYRITTGKSIESSSDNGETWVTEYRPQLPSEAMRAYLAQNTSGMTRFRQPPLDAEFDPQNGNLIFAMGFDGILVRHPDGTYEEVGVNTYQPHKPVISQMLSILFPGEVIMALIFGCLGMVILAYRKPTPLLYRLAIGLAGFIWIFVSLMIPPALEGYSYPGIVARFALGLSGLLLLLALIYNLFRNELPSKVTIIKYLQIILVAGLLFLLPFIIWVFDILPNYRLAQFFGLLLGAGWIYQQYRRNKIET